VSGVRIQESGFRNQASGDKKGVEDGVSATDYFLIPDS
jgi:hypothetical protein